MDLMRAVRKAVSVAALVVVVGWACPAPASWAGLVAADQVSEASYRSFLGDDQGVPGILYTHYGDDRDVGSPQHDLAMANIEDQFLSYGLTVMLEPVGYSGDTYYNVVATKLGTTYPSQEYIIGAHYDSTSFSGSAPGADDNASGVSTVLEAARIISQYDSDYTIRFVAFTREEQGLYGSSAYVDDHIGDDILGMISCDMMAWDPATNTASIWGRDSPALPLKIALGQAISEYSEYQGEFLTPIDRGWNGQSDHAPFDAVGFQACMFIEGEGFNNYTIHSPEDSVDNPGYINYAFATRMTRSIVGFLVDVADVDVPYDALEFTFPDGRPEFVDPAGGTLLRVEVFGVGAEVPDPGTGLLHYDLGGGWQSVAMEIVSPNVYDAVFPAGDCAQQVLYYVSAEAVSGTVYTDPHSAPALTHSAIAAYGLLTYFQDDFETDQSWTVSGDAADGHWDRGVPVGGGDRGDPETDSDGSGQCYLTDNVDGDSDVDDGYTYLTSPAIDLSGIDAHIHYALWYTNNFGADPNNDLFKTYVSDNDGGSWALVETIGPVASAGWAEHTFRVGDFVTPTSVVRVRYEASDLNSPSVVEAGVDDFTAFAFDCNPSADGDYDNDGDVDLYDFRWFQTCFSGDGSTYPAEMGCEDFDFEGDDDVDRTDYGVFQGLIVGP